MRNHVIAVEVNIVQEKPTVLHTAKCAEHTLGMKNHFAKQCKSKVKTHQVCEGLSDRIE